MVEKALGFPASSSSTCFVQRRSSLKIICLPHIFCACEDLGFSAPYVGLWCCGRGDAVFFFAASTQTHPKNVCDLIIMNQRSINHLASRQVQKVVWSVLRNRSIFNASLSKKNWHRPLEKGGVTKSKKPWCRLITGGSHISISWSWDLLVCRAAGETSENW